jgi:hypothetical protein
MVKRQLMTSERTSTEEEARRADAYNAAADNGDVERVEGGIDIVPEHPGAEGHHAIRSVCLILTWDRIQRRREKEREHGYGMGPRRTGLAVSHGIEPGHGDLDARRRTEAWVPRMATSLDLISHVSGQMRKAGRNILQTACA